MEVNKSQTLLVDYKANTYFFVRHSVIIFYLRVKAVISKRLQEDFFLSTNLFNGEAIEGSQLVKKRHKRHKKQTITVPC